MTVQDIVDAALRHSGSGAVPPRPPEEPPHRRRSRRRRRRPRRVHVPSVRTAAAAALVAALVGACVVVVFRDDPRSGSAPAPEPPSNVSRPLAAERAIPGGRVEYWQPTDVNDAYRRITGPDDGVAARGEPSCARGAGEERAWSQPQAPSVVAGRYLCRVGARAEIWWTVTATGVLAHAVRDDGDLAALFTWWRGEYEDANAEHP